MLSLYIANIYQSLSYSYALAVQNVQSLSVQSVHANHANKVQGGMSVKFWGEIAFLKESKY